MSSDDRQFQVERILNHRFNTKTGKLEFLVHFMGFSQFANRWIPSADLRCGHKIREYMRENTVDSIAISREWSLELKSIREAKGHEERTEPRKQAVITKLRSSIREIKTESTPSPHSDTDRPCAEICPPKRRRLNRRCDAYRSHHKQQRRRHTHSTKSISTIDITEARRVMRNARRRASRQMKRAQSSSGPSPNEDTSASEVKSSSSSPSHPFSPSLGKAASLSTHLSKRNSRHTILCGNSSKQGSPLMLMCSTTDSDVSEPPMSDRSSSLCPSHLSASKEYFPSRIGKTTKMSTRPPVRAKLKRIEQSATKRPVVSVLPPAKYEVMTTSRSVTRALRKLVQPAIQYYPKQNSPSTTVVLGKRNQSLGTRQSQRLKTSHSPAQGGMQSSLHSVNDSMESESGRDSVSDLSSSPDLEDSVETEMDQDIQPALRRSCKLNKECDCIGSGRQNGKIPVSLLASTANNSAGPVSSALCSSSDVCIIAVPVNVCTGLELGNVPASIDSFTTENRHSVINHNEYMIFSQNVLQVCRHNVGEVTIPPATVGVSSDRNGGNCSRHVTSRQPVVPPTLSSTTPSNGLSVRMKATEKKRQKNDVLLHRDILPISGTTISHLTCIGDILRSKRSSAYTPTKAVNPLYQMLLDAWELSVYQATAGKEGYVYIENSEDEAHPPLDVHYITERIYTGNVPPRVPRTATEVCNCTDDCISSSSQCCCTTDLTVMPSYFRNGRIKVNHNLPIAECWTSCACGPECSNRVVQRGRINPLCIFRTRNRGWGVKAVVHIPRGAFLATYVGEVISDDEAEERGMGTSQGLTYLFDLDYCKDQGTSVFTVDATNCGNVTRFFNHSCSPNMVIRNVWVETMDLRFPHLAFFASKPIQPGEELTFDYHIEESPENCTPEPCHCGAKNCRGYLWY